MYSDKNSFRTFCKQRLKNSQKRSAYQKDKIFEKNLLDFLKTFDFKNVLLFLPMEIEPCVKNTIKILKASNKNVYVPFIEGISFKIVKYRLPITKGAFNILSCSNSHEFIKKIDLAIVPALGVDSMFYRIGFGRGMYDRFFASIHKKPITLFVQREFCFTKAVIGESHDVSCDYLVLPNKIMKRGRLKNAYNSINGYGRRRLVRTGRVFCSKEDRFRKIPNIHRTIKIKS